MSSLQERRAGMSPTRPPIAPSVYREVFGCVPAAVSVVTAMRRGKPHGTTVSAFAALSLDPPLMLVSLDTDSVTLRAIRRTRAMGINVLDARQQTLARRFAEKSDTKFDGVEWTRSEGGQPRIGGCLGWLATHVTRIVRAGDHFIVIGEIVEAEARDGEPLLYHSRAFRSLRPLATPRLGATAGY